ncbi:hypothetical protein BDB01DRAFT_771268 [Pilobolus umbonatus]|nr:hypothetical protein BDB01DRAFT_771268 [Pilobolus umbonatus]
MLSMYKLSLGGLLACLRSQVSFWSVYVLMNVYCQCMDYLVIHWHVKGNLIVRLYHMNSIHLITCILPVLSL